MWAFAQCAHGQRKHNCLVVRTQAWGVTDVLDGKGRDGREEAGVQANEINLGPAELKVIGVYLAGHSVPRVGWGNSKLIDHGSKAMAIVVSEGRGHQANVVRGLP